MATFHRLVTYTTLAREAAERARTAAEHAGMERAAAVIEGMDESWSKITPAQGATVIREAIEKETPA